MVSYKALSYLACLSAVLSIQAGEYPGLSEMKILSMVPEGDIHDCQTAMEAVKPKKLSLDEKMEMLRIYIKLLEEDFLFNEDSDIGKKLRGFLHEKQG